MTPDPTQLAASIQPVPPEASLEPAQPRPRISDYLHPDGVGEIPVELLEAACRDPWLLST